MANVAQFLPEFTRTTIGTRNFGNKTEGTILFLDKENTLIDIIKNPICKILNRDLISVSNKEKPNYKKNI